MSFAQMHNDYLDPDNHDGSGRQSLDPLAGALPFYGLLEYLTELCHREISRCGLDTEAGMKAATAKALLTGSLDRLKAAEKRRARAQAKPKSPPP